MFTHAADEDEFGFFEIDGLGQHSCSFGLGEGQAGAHGAGQDFLGGGGGGQHGEGHSLTLGGGQHGGGQGGGQGGGHGGGHDLGFGGGHGGGHGGGQGFGHDFLPQLDILLLFLRKLFKNLNNKNLS